MPASQRGISVWSAVALAALFSFTPVPLAAEQSQTWDNLVEVDARGFDSAYLAPGTDFSAYTKVMIAPTSVAFKRNWLRDYNRDARPSDRLSEADAAKMRDEIKSGFEQIFTDAYTKAGYQVVTAPGPDVLMLQTSLLDIDIVAPDVATSARVKTYSKEAGRATFALEARDSMSGAILGRGVDKRTIDDSAFFVRRTSVSNRSDFEQAFRRWADLSVEALGKLRALKSSAPAAP